MAVNEYRFLTRWRFVASISEVSDILEDIDSLSTWWPSVYLRTETLDSGDKRGIGKVVRLLTKGWLPYKLRWNLTVIESNAPHGFKIAAEGDFVGTGEWTLEQRGPFAEVTFDWRISAEKPLLRQWSFLLKPIFAANHRWAMDKGEESLFLELLRRRARAPSELARIPKPPGESRSELLLAGIALLGLLSLLRCTGARRKSRR